MQLTDSIGLVGSGQARLTNQYDCNVYLIAAPDGPVLIDTGSGYEPDRLFASAQDLATELPGPGQTLHAALLTHAHADHSQGGPYLQERDIPIIAPAPSEPLLTSGTEEELGIVAAKRDDVYPDDYVFTHYEPDRVVEPGTSVEVAGRSFEVIQLRGHADDHVAYLTEADGRVVCFIGDALYPDGSISLLNAPRSSLADYRADIENLVDRDIDALLPGHGLPRLADGDEAVELAAEALKGMFTPSSRT